MIHAHVLYNKGDVGQNFVPSFYKRHVREKVRSNFGGKTKPWRQEISKICTILFRYHTISLSILLVATSQEAVSF